MTPSRRTAENSVALMSRFMRVAEFILLRRTGGFDAGGQIARVVPAEARFSQRAQKILQRFETEKIERFVGDLEARAGLPASAALRLAAGIFASRSIEM